MSMRRPKKKLQFETLEPRQMLTGVVINEIHFNSEDNTKAEEFIELYNSGETAVDISGWAFTDGVDFEFPAGTQIPAGGYAVVAEDPAVLLAEFGAVAVGQFAGNLSSDGEKVELSDAQGVVVDEVSYDVGFPWPIAASGDGGSMELIHPGLDNDLGSSWRSSYVTPLFPTTANVAAAGSLSDLVHRWSFNGDLIDSISGADGTLIDPEGNAILGANQLDVSANRGENSDQTPFDEGAYVDLPNGIVSALGDNATFEWWGTVTRNRSWAELFSFGVSSSGEGQSGSAGSQDYLTLIPRTPQGTLRVTHRDGGSQQESAADDSSALSTNVEYHVAVVWDGQTNTQSLYLDGQFIAASTTIIDLSDLNDVNNWLGRSQWGDPLFDGLHNEFRIYNRPLTGAEVAASFADGPDAVLNTPLISSFEVDDADILAGQNVTLSWDVSNFTTLSLDQGIGDVAALTQLDVSPTESATYTLTAINANGTSTRQVTVNVMVPRVTPGLRNNVYAENAAPNIRQVKHTNDLTSGTPAVITAKVTDPDGIASVTLQYQVVLPGQYLPATLPVPLNDLVGSNGTLKPTLNPDYVDAANWTNVVMVDDGTGGDEVAGDAIFTAMVPAQSHRTLVRYRIEVEDTLGLSTMVPYADDPSLNFAFFVYDGVPEYRNAANEIVADAATINSVPVYHFLTRPEEMEEVVAYDNNDQIPQGSDARFSYNWSGTMVYDGEVYDNIHYRLRGANGRYQSGGKRSMRFRFNSGSYFQARDQEGSKYSEKWRTLTTGKGLENHNSLTYSLNEAMSLGLSNLMGLPAAETHWFQFRVIDSVSEAPDPWHGDFWGLNFAVETYDKRFLDNHDLEKGNLYKLINQTTDATRQQRYQASDAVSDGSDHDYIEDLLTRNSTDIEHRVNLEKYFIYRALVDGVRHDDYWATANKNMVYYFEPDYTPENDNLGKLWLLPWDTDASWGPTWNLGEEVVYDALFNNNNSSYAESLLGPQYYNTLREMRDLVWQPDQLEGLINELASSILPLEAADRARWEGAPSDAGNYNGLNGPGATSVTDLVADMLKFAFVGGNWIGGGSGSGFVQAGGRAAYIDDILSNSGEESQIPFTPTITYVGDPSLAANGLQFQTTTFADPQGSQTFGAMEWRISTVTTAAAGLDPNEKFLDEWTSSWDSGVLTTNATLISPTATDVEVGQLHRARVRFQDDSGRWSHWSSPLEFTPTEPTGLPEITITELHYNPNNPASADPREQEFIEILNTGSTTVDLSGIQIADFASTPYVFAGGTSLAAGEYIVVARSTTVFESIHGAGFNLADDDFTGRLSDGGEMISLLTADGTVIESFTYDDKTPWPETPDGTGPSLEIIDPLGDHADPSNWRASAADDGSPTSSGIANVLPGDYDSDGDVDGSDFLSWQRNYGSSVNPSGQGADGDVSGIVDAGDLTVWQGNYGNVFPVQAANFTTVTSLSASVQSTSQQSAAVAEPLLVIASLTSLTPLPGTGREERSDSDFVRDNLVREAVYSDYDRNDNGQIPIVRSTIDVENDVAADLPEEEVLALALDEIFEDAFKLS